MINRDCPGTLDAAAGKFIVVPYSASVNHVFRVRPFFLEALSELPFSDTDHHLDSQHVIEVTVARIDIFDIVSRIGLNKRTV